MRYRLHGKSGLRVSELCLGAMTFGDSWGWGADPHESRAIFDIFAEAGGNFIDTAHIYTDGASERLIGDFIRSDRDHFVVSTKYSSSNEPDISKTGNSLKNMRRSVEESLRRLGTDHIDLYFLHAWDFTTPMEEILRGLNDLVSAGKVLYIGISDTPTWHISRANMMAELRGWTSFTGIQVEYSLAARTADREFLPMAKELDLGVTAWSPLANGVLSGKYLKEPGSETTRQQRDQIPPRNLEISRVVADIAGEVGRSPAQVALAAIRQLHPAVGLIPVIGASKASQIRDNLGSVDLELSAEHLQILDEKTSVELGFPHELLAEDYVKDFAFGDGNYQKLHNHRLR